MSVPRTRMASPSADITRLTSPRSTTFRCSGRSAASSSRTSAWSRVISLDLGGDWNSDVGFGLHIYSILPQGPIRRRGRLPDPSRTSSTTTARSLISTWAIDSELGKFTGRASRRLRYCAGVIPLLHCLSSKGIHETDQAHHHPPRRRRRSPSPPPPLRRRNSRSASST